MANNNLRAAKSAKNDEFYTQFHDIEIEMNAYLEYNPDVFRGKTILLPCDDPEWSNFTKFFAAKFEEYGIKKLISTSYAPQSKHSKYSRGTGGLKIEVGNLFSEYEMSSPQFDKNKSIHRGKIFILERDITGDGIINIDDLEWGYLQGDGDFRSQEVTKLRDEADIIITNPPFSLFREFLEWVLEAKKQFILIANKNCITYKEVFPLIMRNELWSGVTPWAGGMWFVTPDNSDYDKIIDGKYLKNVSSIFITNIDHGRRHEPLPLMTKADNLRFSKHKEIRGKLDYDKYDNYDAIEVPFTDAIPSDYEGEMGVPITFLDKYCPEQFEIIGIDGGDMGTSYGISSNLSETECKSLFREHKGFRKGKLCFRDDEGKLEICYRRILIKHKK